MRAVSKIILHCSASSIIGQRAAIIRRWHLDRKFNDIGYHYFIGFDGKLEAGRDLETIGAHCEGQNKDSVGICLAGLKATDFQPAQFDSLKMLLKLLKRIYPSATVHAHNEFTNKLCPVFDIKPFRELWEKIQLK